MYTYKQLPLEQLEGLGKWRLGIQSGRLRLLISHKGEPLCFLIRFEEDSDELKSIENPVIKSISFNQFKALNYESLKALLKVDLLQITYRGLPKLLAVPERFKAHLYLKIIA